jgi:hypothetical protein
MKITHNGMVLDQQQLNAIIPVLNASMRGAFKKPRELNTAIDDALLQAGCPVTAIAQRSSNTAR